MSNHIATFEAFMSQNLSILRMFTPGCPADMYALAGQAWANVCEHDTTKATYIEAATRIMCEKYLGGGYIMCNGGECALSANRSQVMDLCAEGWRPVAEYGYDIVPDGEEDSDICLDIAEGEDECDNLSCDKCYTYTPGANPHRSEFPSCD